mmetsp:Transcript_19410/g.29183  ORF Transcript_19410/g.29183 Transcript_19410/m.29183 type:complete len:308 (+) Transcript_19410:25-948(+)
MMETESSCAHGRRRPPPAKSFSKRPVLLRPVGDTNVPGLSTVPLGIPFKFESSAFKGKMLVRFRNAKSDNPSVCKAYFGGRKRCVQVVVQGQFKCEKRVSDVFTGLEYARPLKKLPPFFLMSFVNGFVKRIAPAIELDLASEKPKFLAPLASACQTISIDAPGKEPDIACFNIKENTAAWGSYFSRMNVRPNKRKRMLSDPDQSSRFNFDTNKIYTLDFYDDILDYGTFHVKLYGDKLKYDLASTLDGQAPQIMAKTIEGNYIYQFEIWHQRLLLSNSDETDESTVDTRSAKNLSQVKARSLHVGSW